MRAITKGNEPACLTQHRVTAHSSYQNYAGKDALRVALVAEQRGLCCYCMSRIVVDRQKMKIEHWQSQSDPATQHLQLTFSNLLGACKGGEGGRPDQQHCDTRKGNQSLMWNPATPAHAIEARIRYQNNGEIRSDDPQFDSELDTVLGLNISILKNSRKSALEAVLKWWQIAKPNKAQLKAKVAKYDNGVGELEPFSPVAVWYLKRK
ncbi:hypothetical protein [Sphingobium sp. LSP13-1-1.1]|uniref:hypothetical protein n=1 Tax=Sphingobium sp. LSP13-1-1.1 TaxID=3135234 RepID=UPI003434B9CB